MLFALLIALASHAPAAVATPPTNAQPSVQLDTPARRAAAMKIAQSSQPVELLTFGSIKGFQDGTRASVKQDTMIAEYERRYPGFAEELNRRVAPMLAKVIEQSAPSLWARMSDVYVAEMTDDELVRVGAFFASPTGRKLMRTTYENLDVGPLIQDLNSNGKMTIGAATDATVSASMGAVTKLTDAELGEVMRFQIDNAAAIGKTAPKIMAAVTEWQNEIGQGPHIEQFRKAMTDLATEMAAKQRPQP